MTKRNKKKTNPINESSGFLWIPKAFFNSPLYILLSVAERLAYIEMRFAWVKQTHGDYSKTFTKPFLSYTVSCGTAQKMVRKLKMFGEIVVRPEDNGGLYRNRTFYRFRKDGWCNYKMTPQEKKQVDSFYAKKKAARKKEENRRMQEIYNYKKRTGAD